MTDLERNNAAESGNSTGRFAAIRQKIPKVPLDGLKRRLKKGGDDPKPGKRKKKKLTKKQIILLSTGAVVLCVGVYFLVDLFSEEEQNRSRLRWAGKLEHSTEIKTQAVGPGQIPNLKELKAPYIGYAEK